MEFPVSLSFFFVCVVGGKYTICRAVSKTCFVNWSSVTYIYISKKQVMCLWWSLLQGPLLHL